MPARRWPAPITPESPRLARITAQRGGLGNRGGQGRLLGPEAAEMRHLRRLALHGDKHLARGRRVAVRDPATGLGARGACQSVTGSVSPTANVVTARELGREGAGGLRQDLGAICGCG